MVCMKIKDTDFVFCDFGKRHTYKKIIKKILNHAEQVVFRITPFLDNDDEFRNSRWSELSGSFLYSVYDSALSDQPNEKHAMVVLKSDYYVYDYFLNLHDFFEIQEDDKFDLYLQNPAFMKNGVIFCYTISHEELCFIEKELW